jgi:hypothetical protein
VSLSLDFAAMACCDEAKGKDTISYKERLDWLVSQGEARQAQIWEAIKRWSIAKDLSSEAAFLEVIAMGQEDPTSLDTLISFVPIPEASRSRVRALRSELATTEGKTDVRTPTAKPDETPQERGDRFAQQWAAAKPREAVDALALLAPKQIEKSAEVCCMVEALLKSEDTGVRSAAYALFYDIGKCSTPLVNLAKRLEYGIPPDMEEFIVFWHHELSQFAYIEGSAMEADFEQEKSRLAAQGLAEIDTKPWWKQVQLGSFSLIVRYHLFGKEPYDNEPVAATLSGTQLCASFVYAHCYRTDLINSKAKKRLFRLVATSKQCKGLPRAQHMKVKRCSQCHRDDCDSSTNCGLNEPLPIGCSGVDIITSAYSEYGLLLFTCDTHVHRVAMKRIEPISVTDTTRTFGDRVTFVPEHWRSGANTLKHGSEMYAATNGTLRVCSAPLPRYVACDSCSKWTCEECIHICPKSQAMPRAPPPLRDDSQLAKEVENANAEAREQKKLLKKNTLQASLGEHRPDEEEEEEVADDAGSTVLSNKARRRREKRVKQRQAQQRNENKKAEHGEEEARKIRKQVERLKEEAGTKVQQYIDLKPLESALRREGERAKKQEVRTKASAEEVELAHHMLSNESRGGKMRREITAFFDKAQCVKPDTSEAFADTLVGSLLFGGSDPIVDYDAGKAVYGTLADAFRKHEWVDPILKGAGYGAVLSAACATEHRAHKSCQGDFASVIPTSAGI